MRLCSNCWNLTAGQPLFCNKCGSSYSVKLCPRHHPNPRAAKACAECGSKDLSTPQPKAPILVRPLLMLFSIGPGALLLGALLVYLVFYVRQLLNDPARLLPLMCIGFVLAAVFVIWVMLPRFARKSISRFTRRRK